MGETGVENRSQQRSCRANFNRLKVYRLRKTWVTFMHAMRLVDTPTLTFDLEANFWKNNKMTGKLGGIFARAETPRQSVKFPQRGHFENNNFQPPLLPLRLTLMPTEKCRETFLHLYF